jgi:hypothetical protein
VSRSVMWSDAGPVIVTVSMTGMDVTILDVDELPKERG